MILGDLPDLRGTTVAFDLETKDPHLGDFGPGWAHGEGYPVGYGVGNKDWQIYLPFEHGDDPRDPANGNLTGEDREKAKRWLRSHFADEGTPKVAHNLQYDLGWLIYEGYKVAGPLHDTMIQAPLLDEYRYSYALDALAKDKLERRKNYGALNAAVEARWGKAAAKKSGAYLWRLPAPEVEPYALPDVELCHLLHELQMPQIVDQELERIYATEMGVLPILVKMRKKGVLIDRDFVHQKIEEYGNKLVDIDNEIIALTGEHVDPFKAAAIGPIFESRGFEVPRTPKTDAYSITQDWMKTLDDDFARAVINLRSYDRMKGVFFENFLEAYSAKTGRIHAQFNQLKGDTSSGVKGTISGRFSSSDPNLQQIPARDPTFKVIREAFLPEEGERYLAADYSSQEPRWTLHYASILGCRGAAAHVQMFIDNPRTDYHQLTADIMGVERKPAKAINLGIVYGKGGGSLCEELGLPAIPKSFTKDGQLIEYLAAGAEGQALLDKYHSAVPYAKEFDNRVRAQARKKGFIRTGGGRRCRFRWPSEHRKGLNKLIQGTSADQMKLAMIACDAQGMTPLLTVHDELCFSYRKDEEIQVVNECMVNALDCEVPHVVDLEVGPNWGKCE